jgi:RNA polymerase sigma factor (sigma-70 family)
MAAEPRIKAVSAEPSANGRSQYAPAKLAVNSQARTKPAATDASALGTGDTRLQRIIDRFEGRLVRYAARMTGDLERGRDVVQETFLRLCREPAVATSSHLDQWLFIVCRRLALDVRRKETRMNTGDVAAICDLPSAASEPSPMEHAEDVNHVLRLLGSLPANQQEVVRLKFQEGMSYKAIAGITGLSVSNVGFLLHTAVKTLRERMT